MSMFPQKRQVNVAASSKKHIDLSHQHISTMAFGRFKPIECRYMVPGDSFNYDITADIRALSNLPSPTYGQFKMKFRAFFVPIHKIYYNFYEYLSNQFSAVNGNMGDTQLPYTDLAAFYALFTTTNQTYGQPLVELLTSTPSTESEWDIKTVNGQTITYYRLTKRGRRVYDFLTSLGLNLPFKYWDATNLEMRLNIFPIIAFWKFYYDWIVPSRFDNDHDSNIKIFLSIINNIGPSDSPYITPEMIANYLIHDLPTSYFEDDIYTTSTYLPFSDQANMQDVISINNPSSFTSNVFASNSEGLEEEQSGSYAEGQDFNTFTLKTLGKLQDYLNRCLIAGNKIKDWLMSEFGLRPSDDALGLSTYLGKKDFTLDIKGVLSTADTESQGGVALGSYGGYVNNSTNVQFSYDSKEHGYMFITFELIPRTSYVHALNPEWTMLDRFDFFQPEFDNQQGAVIPYEQLNFQNNLYVNRVYGFNLQYATLKNANDVMSGDFKNRYGFDLKSWFLSRNLPIIAAGNTRISEEYCKVISQYQDWDYIFADTEDDVDHWLTYFNIRNHAMRPMKQIIDGFEPEYMNSNKNVTLSFNGAAD